MPTAERQSMGLVYRSALVYRTAMTLLERSHGAERRRRIVELIPAGAAVVDLCCGDARIARPLERKGCRYLGLDVNRRFVAAGVRRGLDVRYWDAETMDIPDGDVVCMLSSLYHFIPDEQRLFDRMVERAGRMVVISEPVSNWTTSGSPLLRFAARVLTSVNGRTYTQRHSVQSLRALVADLEPDRVELTELGRELLLVVRQ
jgi:trans-aconitate methyltransferase